ncbi:hypothetical protein B0H14DRAFT_3862984 [Mycena olivaceomarginata]|nr:hypothetical protein B0H14DRAFT_3862984 [Mycena olivaceomarginata]
MSSARRSGLQKEILNLYRRALRIPRTKPTQTRAKWDLLIRYSFRNNAASVSPRDVSAIDHLLRVGGHLFLPDVGDVDDDGAEDNSPAAVDKEMIGLMTNLVALEKTMPDALDCDECREDSTCTPTDIARDWKRFLVAAHALGEDPDSGRTIWRCPWCGQEEVEDLDDTLGEVQYFSKAYLIRHIVEDHAEEDREGAKRCASARGSQTHLWLCRANPSLPDLRRFKPFPSMAAKKAHLKAILHQPEARTIRMLKKDCSSGPSRLPGLFPLPHIVDYHPDLSPDVLDIYEEIDAVMLDVFNNLVEYLETEDPIGNNNWAAKEAAGWGEDIVIEDV